MEQSLANREDHLLNLLNAAWALIEPRPRYDEVNIKFRVPDISALEVLEKESKTLGLSDFGEAIGRTFGDVQGMTWVSLIATITDELCGKRLAAIVEDDGTISGWTWYKNVPLA